MPNYSKGVIYTIRYRNDDNLIYVGSTCQLLTKRWFEHKINCFNENRKNYNMRLYQKIRETNDIDNWYIELYESYPCANKQELNKREGEVIREIGNLNTQIAGRTKKEYKNDNKDKIKEQRKEYYESNKEKEKDYQKEWYENNKEELKKKIKCDCGVCYTRNHKARHLKSKKHEEYLNSL